VSALPESLRPLRGFLLRRADGCAALLYTTGAPHRLDPALPVREATDLLGEPLPARDVLVGLDPVYLSLEDSELAAVLEILSGGSSG
jgi:hypothetical protein